MKKYAQQIIVAILLIGAAAGVAFAGPSFDITTLVSGFIRYTGQDHGVCDPEDTGDYCYGYGWSGNLLDWGYGYGYKSIDFGGEESATLAAQYGFDGDDGSATIESVEVDKTTATIVYSTNYLARGVLFWSTIPNPTDPSEFTLVGAESGFNSGERIISITSLTCDTQYYFAVVTHDSADNTWITDTQTFTTDSCFDPEPESIPRTTISGSISAINKTKNSASSVLRLPPITLALGSVGVDVQDLQRLLNYFGTFLASNGAGSPNNETEFFGRRTFNAVKNFQKTFGLAKVDGIYGEETRGIMESFLK